MDNEREIEGTVVWIFDSFTPSAEAHTGVTRRHAFLKFSLNQHVNLTFFILHPSS